MLKAKLYPRVQVIGVHPDFVSEHRHHFAGCRITDVVFGRFPGDFAQQIVGIRKCGILFQERAEFLSGFGEFFLEEMHPAEVVPGFQHRGIEGLCLPQVFSRRPPKLFLGALNVRSYADLAESDSGRCRCGPHLAMDRPGKGYADLVEAGHGPSRLLPEPCGFTIHESETKREPRIGWRGGCQVSEDFRGLPEAIFPRSSEAQLECGFCVGGCGFALLFQFFIPRGGYHGNEGPSFSRPRNDGLRGNKGGKETADLLGFFGIPQIGQDAALDRCIGESPGFDQCPGKFVSDDGVGCVDPRGPLQHLHRLGKELQSPRCRSELESRFRRCRSESDCATERLVCVLQIFELEKCVPEDQVMPCLGQTLFQGFLERIEGLGFAAEVEKGRPKVEVDDRLPGIEPQGRFQLRQGFLVLPEFPQGQTEIGMRPGIIRSQLQESFQGELRPGKILPRHLKVGEVVEKTLIPGHFPHPLQERLFIRIHLAFVSDQIEGGG